ncbi:AEC family transporter [Herbaspirillum sp. RTI4]|uniref:AEC family transporter n=1 Tax=Herbaspirillum sp. RTI4 TaxID=3048640 RepID=UPI002AB32A2E|nr:AEC family transporter [Herbaspirillum sp. RTI4]MDY7577458.1 AEC family transporter [Herbaspirillum sp. RTI4]MEA9981734.1 AEC family transporter [Herbaspirillum sp. RTI4]
MSALLNVIFPVFFLILLGYVLKRKEVFRLSTAAELNRFVIYVSLPALLFDLISTMRWSQLGNLPFIAVFGLSIVGAFLLTLLIRLRQGVPAIDAILDGLASSYSNVGFIGLPICLLAFGPKDAAPAVVATVMTACVLFAITIVMLESVAHANQPLGRALKKVGLSLCRNPVVVAPLLGLTIASLGLTLPSGLQQVVHLLGAAATPCALISIGVFLAVAPVNATRQPVTLLLLVKLLLQPALAAVLAYWVFDLPPTVAGIAVLLAALPIGSGPFMLAELYGREASGMSRAILLSTLGSLLTVSLLLYWLFPH